MHGILLANGQKGKLLRPASSWSNGDSFICPADGPTTVVIEKVKLNGPCFLDMDKDYSWTKVSVVSLVTE